MTRVGLRAIAIVLGYVILWASAASGQNRALKIVVIAGEDAVNVIQQKTAVAPIVEVRDRNDLPVAGATVVFALNGSSATFSGAQTLTVVTNTAGRATAAGLTPTSAGALRVTATATFQGQTATATISQSNVITASDAATLSKSGRAASGGGISAATVIAIVGGIGAVGAGVAVAAGGSSSDSPTSNSTTQTPTASSPTTPASPAPTTPPNSAPVITSASVTPDAALAGADTAIALQVQASDADNDPLTYLWEFPDGSRSSQRAFSRVFGEGGTHLIRVTVSDGKTSTSSELSLDMKTMTGSWEVSGAVGSTGQFDLVQSGGTIGGEYFVIIAPYLRCRANGSIGAARLQIVTSQCVNLLGTSGFQIPATYTLSPGADVDTLVGTINLQTSSLPTAITMRRTR